MDKDIELEYKTTSRLTISKKNQETELLIFSLPLFGGLEMAVIVTIPSQNDVSAPVYVKIRKARRPRSQKISDNMAEEDYGQRNS